MTVPPPRSAPGPQPAGAGPCRTWRPPGPVDVPLTLGVLCRGPGDPAYRTAPDGAVWRASRTPAGPGTVRIAARPAEGVVEAQAWGPGAAWLLDRLPDLLGAADDPSGFAPDPRHRLLHDAHRRHPGLRLGRTGLVMESLVPAVLEQKVTVVEAHRGWRLLLQWFGTPAPGPAAAPGSPVARMRVAPAARDWAAVPSWEWHRAGVDARRAAAVVRAARLAPRLEEASAMGPAEAVARLTAVAGIGVWTAAETLQRSNGDPDAVSVGDLHLPNTVGWVLAGRHRTDDAGMLELLEPYLGHRHRACRLVRLCGARPPRRAPRFAPRDFRAV
ncbi:DNA-3-methyladenine glycosylase family protein [Streptomyces sp. NPDC001380]|uniref:DNA-3-methyladenine glycosylase family protein n=1 Tax=Streptomyces sp. NPDC001380 TaxID=3364566 RepID=UPI0036904840